MFGQQIYVLICFVVFVVWIMSIMSGLGDKDTKPTDRKQYEKYLSSRKKWMNVFVVSFILGSFMFGQMRFHEMGRSLWYEQAFDILIDCFAVMTWFLALFGGAYSLFHRKHHLS